MRLGFEVIGERLQRRRLVEAMCERLFEQPVGEPRVPRQERAMQVRPDGTPDATALPAALAVVAEPGHDAAERLRTRIQASAPRVVLESRERAAHAGLELALQEDVADHARVAGDRVQGEEADPRQVGALDATVRAPEELI